MIIDIFLFNTISVFFILRFAMICSHKLKANRILFLYILK
ncbi:hypothetical protein BGAFAR04_K0009 (plasmid) [Borreliella garinii Far04]|nr:hypothetical protein BGAFAR04_K0009 [Borreliella garinii Far04]